MEKTKGRKSASVRRKVSGASGWVGGRYYDSGLSGIVAILGQPRTGKSFRMAQLARRCNRAAVFDPMHQYGNSPSGTALPGFVVVSQPGELVEYLRRRRGGAFRVVYQPANGDAEHFDYFLRVMLAVRTCVVFCDEIWMYMTASWMPATLKTATLTGRHRGLSLVYTAQVPARVNYDLRSITTNWKLFRMTLRRNLDAVSDFVPPEVLEQVRRLPDRVFIEIDDQGNSRRSA